eukprot:CAMPEP_0184025260 /NCGR_PEP_ID=MMETSP0954-20121128/12683_1 /TAXON_ID=627963 /ORGANISM="Aplanochytrium sp, Strain PBS07" /LENGTH=586 /DNA_ID=CAMNT_0026308967 /DNA_START=216 /DNA_END=1973 /DNA_ORIENTATION=+
MSVEESIEDNLVESTQQFAQNLLVERQISDFSPQDADIFFEGNSDDFSFSNGSLNGIASRQDEPNESWWNRWFFRHRVSSRLAEDEYLLTPSMHDSSRTSSRGSAITSLVATMVGGGVLSLPYALSRAGVLLGLFYLILSANLSAFSIRLLLSCARRSGATTYEEVALKAFGPRVKYLTVLLVVVLTFLAMVGYLILARDLAVPLVESYIVQRNMERFERNLVAIILLLLVSPLCFATSLHSLRFTSLASLFALLVLSVAIVYKCIERSEKRTVIADELKFVSGNVHDSLYAFPFMQVAFMCHFNVLPVHTGLRLPTRKRLDCVVSSTMTLSALVYMLVAISGYLYAYDHSCTKDSASTCVFGVPDNILNAFDVKDPFIDLGRFGLMLALLLSLPLLVLPSRESFLRLLSAGISRIQKVDSVNVVSGSNGIVGRDEYVQLEGDDQESRVPGSRVARPWGRTMDEMLYASSDVDTPGRETLEIIDTAESPEFRTAQLRRMRRRISNMNDIPVAEELSRVSNFVHIASTIGLLGMAVFIMISVPGVGFIWSITGSTVSIILAFILPAAFYLKIRSTKGGVDARRALAW